MVCTVRDHHLRLVAVSCRHHPLVIDEGTSTEVVARVQGHLVGDRILLAGVSSNNLVIIIHRESNLNKQKKAIEKTIHQDARSWSPQLSANQGFLMTARKRRQEGSTVFLIGIEYFFQHCTALHSTAEQ